MVGFTGVTVISDITRCNLSQGKAGWTETERGSQVSYLYRVTGDLEFWHADCFYMGTERTQVD